MVFEPDDTDSIQRTVFTTALVLAFVLTVCFFLIGLIQSLLATRREQATEKNMEIAANAGETKFYHEALRRHKTLTVSTNPLAMVSSNLVTPDSLVMSLEALPGEAASPSERIRAVLQ